MVTRKIIRRGDIYEAELGNQIGSIQSGTRPVLIISNNMNNKYSPVVNVLPITSKTKNNIPVHVDIGLEQGLGFRSTILTEQIVTINKNQLGKYIGACNTNKMYEVENAILIQNGINITNHYNSRNVTAV